jgi:HAD superfamily hydrolase (TIGR01509 family)
LRRTGRPVYERRRDIWHHSLVSEKTFDRPTSTTSTQPPAAASGDLSRLPQPEALLFDLDGTLVDTVPLRVEAWRRVFEHAGLQVAPEFLGQYMGSDGRWLAGDVATKYGRDLSWAEKDQLDRESGDAFDELNRSPRPLPGATDLLTALESAQGLTFAIATSSQPGQVAASVSALGLPATPRITDGSHVEHAKPEPDLLIESARQLGVAPQRCWYVGDSKWDMIACLRAGMIGVAVTTGATPADVLLEAGAAVALDGLAPIGEELRRRGLID